MKKFTILTQARRILLAGSMLVGASSWAQEFNIFGLTNQVWKYDSTNDWYGPTGLGWTEISFDDSAWPSGRAILTSDNNAEIIPLRGTIIRDMRVVLPGVPGATANQAVYFRTHFNWPGNASPAATLRLTVRVDDGCAVYLNGHRVGGLRMPDPTLHNSFSTGLVPCVGPSGNNDGTCDEVILIDGTWLQNGDNVLSVTAHSNNGTSSDVTWGCRLDVIIPFAPVLTDDTQPTNRTVLESRSTTLSAFFNGSPVPTVQWYFQPGIAGGGTFTAIPDATNATYTITNMALANEGLYYALISNVSGSTNTRTAVVQFTDDSTPPTLVRAIGSANFTNIVLEFSEGMDAATAGDGLNYTISGGYAVTRATLLPNRAGVLLDLDAPLPEDTLFTVTLSDVTDLAGVPVDAGSSAQFRSWTTVGCNGLKFDVFTGLSTSDNAMSQLTNNVNFPNNPAERYTLSRFDTREVFTGDTKDGYGGRLTGLFIPQQSGPWNFFIRSDDGSILYLNPNGPSPAGKQQVAIETGCCGNFMNAGAPETSVPFNLVAGQGYYIEAIYKEGGGGDWLKVAARLVEEGTPPVVGNAELDTNAIPASMLGTPAVPVGVVGPVILVQQPASITVAENTPSITLSTQSTNAQGAAICYQWQRSDAGGPFTDILNARGPTLTIPYPTIAADGGDVYRALVQVPGASAISAEATITVTVDVTPPRVTRVVATSATSLAVYFSEPLAAGSEEGFNYLIDPGSIGLADGVANVSNPVRLDMPVVTPLTPGNTYTLNVGAGLGAIADRAGNLLSPDPTFVTFRSQVYTNNPDTLVTLSTNNALPLGSLTQRGILGRIVQVPGPEVANVTAIREQMLAGVYPSATNPMAATIFGGSFIETNAINYEMTAGTNLVGVGHITPDLQFPGFPLLESTPGAFYNNMTMEAVAYVELRKGAVTMGVNSDDGFTVTPALSITDPAATNILGQFEGGRGASDSTFGFFVEQDGLYPFRLMWEQGGGGASVEWWVLSDDNTVFQPINSATNGPPAFVPPCSNKDITAQLVATNLIVQWPDAGLGHLFVLQQSGALGSPTVWSNAVNIPQLIGGSRTATIPVEPGENCIFRLHKAGPPCP